MKMKMMMRRSILGFLLHPHLHHKLTNSILSSQGWLLRRFASERVDLSGGIGSHVMQKRGKVFSFGDGSHGALGHNDNGLLCDVYEPMEVEGIPDGIVRVAAGHYHSLAVSASGELWAWGRNVEGQLGSGVRERWAFPKKVQGLEGANIKQAAGSGVVSMAIDVDGFLWAWGKSERGQLGLGEGVTETMIPQRIHALAGQQVLQVALGWGHTLACTSEGELYAWGYCSDGQLGFSPKIDSPPECSLSARSQESMTLLDLVDKQDEQDMRGRRPVIQWEPHIVDLQGLRAIDVACGLDHSLVICEGGILLSFGDDTYGQLGRAVGRESVQHVRGNIFGQRVLSTSSGLGHSLAIAVDSGLGEPWCRSKIQNAGTLYSWGWNSAFQLGREIGRKPAKVEGLPDYKVVQSDGGRVHTVAVTSEGQLWTWGSGKNGRLGLGSFTDEQHPCLVKSISDIMVQQAVCGMDHTLLLLTER